MLRHGVLFVVALVAFVVADYPVPIPRIAEDDIVTPFADDTSSIQYRLPNNTVPISYNVALTTNVHADNFEFNGVVAIRLRAVTASRTITIHQRQLTINSGSLRRADDTSNTAIANTFAYDLPTEMLTFTLTSVDLIANTEYILTINYNGTLRTDNAGFYRSSYVAASGSRVWLATTQFESTDARHGFPCYDEPALRAKYTISITHGAAYNAISNAPVVSVVPSTNGLLHTTTFAETPAPTPSYLIAFIVSNFEYKENTIPKVPQRVYARPNAIQNADLGLDGGVKILTALENYFGIEFAFPKMDQVAIPDFAAGAMENWGLVTYREEYLLFSEAENTFTNKRNIITVIAHEYAHQWFGNLVTPKWWTYLWLNEGFATLFEYYATEWVYPEWKILDAFVPSTVQTVFVSDSLPTTRPMTHYVENPTDISNLFNHVVYAKAGTVLRMFLNAFTENSFKKGLITYLNDKKNTDATEEDLFAHLEQAVRQDNTLNSTYNVATIFSSWSRQAGFPVVTVERVYTSGLINLSQEQYQENRELPQTASIWWIPYNYASASSANFDVTSASGWISTRTSTLVDSSIKAEDWFLLNKRQTGYYRVKYDLQNYKLLSAALISNKDQIHLASRSQLIDDAFDFARTERQGYDVAFDIIKYLEHEVEYVPWASAFRGLDLVDRLYSGNANYASYASYLRKLLAHLYSDAGLVAKADEHHYRKQARNQAIRWSCHYGNTDCLQQTHAAVEDYLTRNVALHQDHRAMVLCNGIRNATTAQYQALASKLATETDQTERYRIVDALACHSDSAVTKAYLETSTGDESPLNTATERYRAFFEVAGINTNGTQLAIEFLEANFDDANRRYGTTNVNRAIVRVANFVNNDALTEQFNKLIAVAAQKSYITESFITTAQNTVANNKKWIERNSPVIEEWIRTNGASHFAVSSIFLVVLLAVSQLF